MTTKLVTVDPAYQVGRSSRNGTWRGTSTKSPAALFHQVMWDLLGSSADIQDKKWAKKRFIWTWDYFIWFFYYTPSCQHHKLIFLGRCLHDVTQLGEAEDRSGVPTSVLMGSMLWVEPQWFCLKFTIWAVCPESLGVIYGSLVSVWLPWGAFGFTPRAPKRAA